MFFILSWPLFYVDPFAFISLVPSLASDDNFLFCFCFFFCFGRWVMPIVCVQCALNISIDVKLKLKQNWQKKWFSSIWMLVMVMVKIITISCIRKQYSDSRHSPTKYCKNNTFVQLIVTTVALYICGWFFFLWCADFMLKFYACSSLSWLLLVCFFYISFGFHSTK